MIRGDFRIPPVQPIHGYPNGKENSHNSKRVLTSVKEVTDSSSDFDIILDISIKIKDNKKVQQSNISPFEEYMLNRNYKRLN